MSTDRYHPNKDPAGFGSEPVVVHGMHHRRKGCWPVARLLGPRLFSTKKGANLPFACTTRIGTAPVCCGFMSSRGVHAFFLAETLVVCCAERCCRPPLSSHCLSSTRLGNFTGYLWQNTRLNSLVIRGIVGSSAFGREPGKDQSCPVPGDSELS